MGMSVEDQRRRRRVLRQYECSVLKTKRSTKLTKFGFLTLGEMEPPAALSIGDIDFSKLLFVSLFICYLCSLFSSHCFNCFALKQVFLSLDNLSHLLMFGFFWSR